MPEPILSPPANWGPLSSSPQGLCRHTHSRVGCLPITAPGLKINSLLRAGTCQHHLLSQLSQSQDFPQDSNQRQKRYPNNIFLGGLFWVSVLKTKHHLSVAQQPKSILGASHRPSETL